ncbi:MAG: hypothetical protein Sapg2KO_53440 [Saprospiraceae bacterium]
MTGTVGFILMTGIVITVLILLSLFNSKDRDHSKFILTVFFTFTLLVNLSAYASLHGMRLIYILTFVFDFSIVWLIGPLLLIYIRSLFEEKRGLINYLVHFIPVFILILFIGIPLVISFLVDSFQLAYLDYLDKNQAAIIVIRDLYCLFYLGFAWSLFKAYQEKAKHIYATLSENDFGWIKRLLFLCLTFITADLLFNLLELFQVPLPFHSGFVIMCFIIVVTIYLGYYGIKQSSILLPDFLSLNVKNQKASDSFTFTPDKKMETLKLKFVQQMQSEKYFKEEDLNLHKLASYFDLTDKQLSLLLNQYIGMSFYDYINLLRVEEVKKKLVGPEYDQFTILALAYDSGFNSKATFNRIFKKETGLTPSNYRKVHKISPK